jgi:hypothetical protein
MLPVPPLSLAKPREPPTPLDPWPGIRLDPALNMVVPEFRDAGGEVEYTIPSERQLAAYRNGQAAE